MDILSQNTCFGGKQIVFRHPSRATQTDMTFGLFLPDTAAEGPVPVLWYLSGLTCTHENAMTKAGAQAWASEAGIAVCFPDTSPRGEDVADDEAYDLGQGAGFYVNATQTPWAPHFQMWDYVTEELPALLIENDLIMADRQAITGHSMGGHGALTAAMRKPEQYRSVSAFAPICNPTESDWGRKQLAAYLGDEKSQWAAHDATLLMQERGFPREMLIDTGTDDQFTSHLGTAAFAKAAVARGQALTLRMQPGYDHSYFFVQSFMEDHVAFHAEALWS